MAALTPPPPPARGGNRGPCGPGPERSTETLPTAGGGAKRARPRPAFSDRPSFPVAPPPRPAPARGTPGAVVRAVPERAAAMDPGAAAALALTLLLAAAARPAAAWDLWALRCGFSADCECGFGPDLRGQRAEGWGSGGREARGAKGRGGGRGSP